MRNRRRPSLRTTLSLVLMRRNLSSMIPAIDFAALHGIDSVSCVHMMAFTADMAEESALLDLRAYRAAYDAALAHAHAKGVYFAAPAPIAKSKPRKGHAPCEFPWKGTMVTGDGDVHACCMPGSVVGNLSEASLIEIWNGPRMQAFRAAVNTRNPPPPCSECGVYRHENNYESYVPGLSKTEREAFAARVSAQF
jgi:radical SAM protein with 4Fe4S-binding SPASM domain